MRDVDGSRRTVHAEFLAGTRVDPHLLARTRSAADLGRLTFGIETRANTEFYFFEGLLRLDWVLFSDALKHILLRR